MSPMNNRLLRPLANGFNPKSIAGLAAWWDSTDNSTITTDTGVSAWADKSGNGYTLEQSTGANQPTLSTINGKQAFEYNGSSQYLTSTDAGLAAVFTGNTVQPVTMFCVLQKDDNTTGGRVMHAGNTTDGLPFVGHLIAGSIGTWNLSYRDNGTSADSASSTATYSGGVPYVTSSNFSVSQHTGRVNGSEVVTVTPVSALSTATFDNFTVGAWLRTSLTTPYAGLIGDVLIYNRVLTLAEIQRVERWLAGKYGVTLA